MEKMTYVKALAIAMETVTDEAVKEKLSALATSIAKKNGAERKPTATQKANADLKVAILDTMVVGKGYTISEMIKTFPILAECTNQKVSAIVRQLVAENKVTRTEDKRKAIFTKVA